MKKIVIATSNQHKVVEFKEMLEPFGYQVLSLLDIEKKIDIVEDGATFEENAYLKAKQVFEVLKCEVISDDSGLCIDALDGKPGLHSARFMGEDTPYQTKNAYFLEELANQNNRSAQYVCVLCHMTQDGQHKEYRGVCEGEISREIVGTKGFGYDPIFYYPEFETTLANVSDEEKNKISHRGKALALLLQDLNQ